MRHTVNLARECMYSLPPLLPLSLHAVPQNLLRTQEWEILHLCQLLGHWRKGGWGTWSPWHTHNSILPYYVLSHKMCCWLLNAQYAVRRTGYEHGLRAKNNEKCWPADFVTQKLSLIWRTNSILFVVVVVCLFVCLQWIVSGSEDNSVYIWNLQTKEIVQKLEGHKGLCLSNSHTHNVAVQTALLLEEHMQFWWWFCQLSPQLWESVK